MNKELEMLERYVNQQINIMVEQEKELDRYQKRYVQGALSFAKKIQNKIIEFRKDRIRGIDYVLLANKFNISVDEAQLLLEKTLGIDNKKLNEEEK